MAGLIIGTASDLSSGQLLLRVDDPVLGQRSLSRNLDPKTAQPGDLPSSCIDYVEQVVEQSVVDGYKVVFADGTDVLLDGSAYVEAVSR